MSDLLVDTRYLRVKKTSYKTFVLSFFLKKDPDKLECKFNKV